MSSLSRLKQYAGFFYVQRIKGFVIGDEPWMDEATGTWFAERLARAASYMEFGSGGSTRLAARLGVPTISVEGDRFYARAVRAGLAEGHRVHLLDAPIGLTGPWGVPLPGKPTAARVRKWRTYVDLPFAELARQQIAFPDLVLVDGRFRRACALRTAHEASLAGARTTLLIDDYYSEGRDRYTDIEQYLGAPVVIGRSACFELDKPDVPQAAIDQALMDYR